MVEQFQKGIMTNCESQIFGVIYIKVSDDPKKTSGKKGRWINWYQLTHG